MHNDTPADPEQYKQLLLCQSLNILTDAILADPRRTKRQDLRTLVAILPGVIGDEPWSWQALATRSGLTEKQLRASMRRLRKGGFLTPQPGEDFLLLCSTPGEPSVPMSELQSMARRGELRIRVFGETKPFALGVPNFGSLDDAVNMLPRLIINGLFALYRDESGLFLGPPNPAMIDLDPFGDLEVGDA